MMTLLLLIGLLAPGIVLGAVTSDGGVLLSHTDEKLALPLSAEKRSGTIHLPGAPKPADGIVAIALDQYAAGGTGSSFVVSFKLNGKPLGEFNASGKSRLLDRVGKRYLRNRSSSVWWKRIHGTDRIIMFYGEKGQPKPPMLSHQALGTRFVFDGTDLWNEKGTNTLEATFHLTFNDFNGKRHPIVFHLEDAAAVAISSADAARRRGETRTVKRITIPRVKTPADGMAKLDLVRLSDGQKPELPTKVQIGYDKENLYISAECFENDFNAMRTLFFRPEDFDNIEISGDDYVDITLEPYGGKEFYQLFINSAGIVHDALVGRVRMTNWDSNAKVTAERNAKSWKLAIAIPFSSIGMVPNGNELWRINVGRVRTKSGEVSSLMHGPGPLPSNTVEASFAGDASCGSLQAVRRNNTACLRYAAGTAGHWKIALTAVDGEGKLTNFSRDFKTSKSGEPLEVAYPGISDLRELRIKASHNGREVYSNTVFFTAGSAGDAFLAWKVKNPLYQELLSGSSYEHDVITWPDAYVPSRNEPLAIQYGFEYSLPEMLQYALKSRQTLLYNAGIMNSYCKSTASAGVEAAIQPYPNNATNTLTKKLRRPFLFDPAVQIKMMQDVEKIIEARRKNNIRLLYIGDELESCFKTGIELKNILGKDHPFIRKMETEVKRDFGGGHWGIPDSMTDSEPGRWIAWQGYISHRIAKMTKEIYKTVRAKAPELLVTSVDPISDGKVCDLTSWRGCMDIATMQVLPGSSPAQCRVGFISKKLSDLTRAPRIQPCVHFENYGVNLSTAEMLAFFSQSVRCGATGFQYFSNDVRGFNNGRNNLGCEFFGAPEREAVWAKIAPHVPKLKFPRSEYAFYFAQDTDWSAPYKVSPYQIPAFSMLGQQLGIWFTIANEEALEQEKKDRYQVIFVTDAKFERESQMQWFKNFVEQGGRLIVFDPQAFAFDNFASQRKDDFTGMRPVEKSKTQAVKLNGKLYPAISGYALKGDTQCKTLAEYADGTPAVMQRRIGKGEVVRFGFAPFTGRTVEDSRWLDFSRNMAKLLDLKTDAPVWRFAFPDTMLPKITPPDSMNLTGNGVIWHRFQADTQWNEKLNRANYSYSRNPDVLSDRGGVSNIPFGKGALTDRLRVLKEGNAPRKASLNDRMSAFRTEKPMSIAWDFTRMCEFKDIALFFQGNLPAGKVGFSADGHSFVWQNFKARQMPKQSVGALRVTFPKGAAGRFILIQFAKGNGVLNLVEADVHGKVTNSAKTGGLKNSSDLIAALPALQESLWTPRSLRGLAGSCEGDGGKVVFAPAKGNYCTGAFAVFPAVQKNRHKITFAWHADSKVKTGSCFTASLAVRNDAGKLVFLPFMPRYEVSMTPSSSGTVELAVDTGAVSGGDKIRELAVYVEVSHLNAGSVAIDSLKAVSTPGSGKVLPSVQSKSFPEWRFWKPKNTAFNCIFLAPDSQAPQGGLKIIGSEHQKGTLQLPLGLKAGGAAKLHLKLTLKSSADASAGTVVKMSCHPRKGSKLLPSVPYFAKLYKLNPGHNQTWEYTADYTSSAPSSMTDALLFLEISGLKRGCLELTKCDCSLE